MLRHLLLLTVSLLFLGNHSIQAQCAADPGFSAGITTSSLAPELASSYSPGFTSQFVHLQNNFLIDVNFSINSNTIIRVDNGYEIIVQAGSELTIDASTVSNCDLLTWYQIRVNPGGSILVKNGSIIENAETGILAEAASPLTGAFSITNSHLLNNFTGLYVQPYFGAYPGVIINSDVSSPNTLSTAVGDVTGIHLDDCGDITIGITSNSLGIGSDHNQFYDLDIGIITNNVGLTLQDNSFDDIAIGCVGIFGGVGYIGAPDPGVTGINNSFENSTGGIFNQTGKDLFVDGNYFDNLNGAVWCQNSFGTVEVTNNDIDLMLNYGVRIVNQNTAYLVDNNDIDNSSNPSIAANNVVGIQIQNPTAAGTVSNNTITDFIRGIEADAMMNGFITDNTVYYIQPGGLQSRGIRARGSNYIEITGNYVEADYSGSGDELKTVGIYIQNSPEFIMDKNRSNNSGCGVRIDGGNFDCHISCTIIEDCVYGFALAGITDPATMFGVIHGNTSMTQASGNRWLPASTQNRTYSISGTRGDFMTWYYNTSSLGLSFGFDMPVSLMTNDGVFPVADVTPTVSSSEEICGAIPSPPARLSSTITPEERDDIFQELINDFLSDGLLNCSDYGKKELFHDFFENQSDLLTLGDPSDIDYQQLFNSLNNANFDELGSAFKILEQDGLAPAIAWNNAVTPYCQEEIDWKRVQEIYLDAQQRGQSLESLLNEELPYTSSETLELEAIAIQEGTNSEPSVFRARAMLGWEETEAPVAKQTYSQDSDLQDLLTLTPNPANEFTIIKSDKEIAMVDLFDLNGKLLVSHIANTNAYVLKLQDFDSGMYLVQITYLDGSVGKAQIIKE